MEKEKKKKIVVFSGAGVSAESGVATFRDAKTGLWENHKVEDVASPEGWRRNRGLVLKFYNERRRQLPTVQPNDAHKLIAELEKDYDVTVVTQNVDDLHERGGSTKIIHLHGELTKARGCFYNHKPSPADNIIDIGYNDINEGDKCPVTDSQLRPHIVWFGEYPFGREEAMKAMEEADILIIVGTSLMITYTLHMLTEVPLDCRIFFIDPKPSPEIGLYRKNVKFLATTATAGMKEVYNELMQTENV